MRQFLLPRRYAGEPRATLGGDDFHYLVRVLRLRAGEAAPAVDARGARYEMRIARVGREDCEVELAPAAALAASPAREAGPRASIALLQCLPKGRKIDLIVRQATEAGVCRIVPLYSERSLVRPGDDANRLARLRRIAREALQQCGGARLPDIEEPRQLAALAAEAAKGEGAWGTGLFFHQERVEAATLHELLADAPRAVSVLIGPEGGLSPGEVAALTAAGFRPAFLGGTVLRAETAALYAIGAVTTILQERDAWTPVRRK